MANNARMYSLLGQRGTFGVKLDEVANDNDSIVAITSDLTRTSGLERFFANHPDRSYNVGIAEQNSIGFAAGLADNGYVPFVTTFTNFSALRSNEFIRHYLAYMKCNVKVVGLGSGFAMELFGNTHYGVEDIGAMRSFPNIEILSPCDGLEVARCVEYCAETRSPVYLRLSGRANNPIVNKDPDYDFKPGRGITLADGSDIVIYATGSMVANALKASKQLGERGISAGVVNMHTIKPLDADLIRKNCGAKMVVSVEEHSVIGGLGSAISEVLSSQRTHPPLLKLGVQDRYIKAGRYEYMLAQNGLDVPSIVETIAGSLQDIMKA